MRVWLGGLGAVAVGGVVALVFGLAPAAASCAEGLEWRGTFYVGWRTAAPITQGTELRGAKEPVGCADAPGETQQFRVTAGVTVRGVTPEAVIARKGERRRVYLAPGFFPQLRDFPLHQAIYGSSARPDARTWEKPPGERFFTCDRVVRRTIVGTPRATAAGLMLRTAKGIEYVAIDVRTRIPHRRGRLPRVRHGDRIRARVTRCERGSHFRRNAADFVEINP